VPKSTPKPARITAKYPAPLAQAAHGRPAWVEISATALQDNYELLHYRAAGFDAGLICVVKANAYGHGLFECARVLRDAGAEWYAVTSVDEGMQLVHRFREEGPPLDLDAGRVLILSGVFDAEDAVRAVRHRLTPVALSLQHVLWLADAAREEVSPLEKFPVHFEIDTGMARNGVRWDDTAQLDAIAEALDESKHIQIEGVLTHLASPDDPSSPQTRQQLQRFEKALKHLYAVGVRPRIIHVGNSVTLFDASQTDALAEIAHTYGAKLLLRPGLALYGYGVEGVKPVLTWKSRVTSLRRLQAGDAVSYNATFHTMRATTVATLATGYADGYNRLLSNKGSVLIRGKRAAVLGRVTMDQIMVDVSLIEDAAIGDEAVLLGTQDDLTISAVQIATLTGTIAWEVLCAIGARVERVVVE
jgi:alanine racemase